MIKNIGRLPKEAVEEFKQIYKKEYQRELSDEEAYRLANNLLNLYTAVYLSRVNVIEKTSFDEGKEEEYGRE